MRVNLASKRFGAIAMNETEPKKHLIDATEPFQENL